MSYVQKNLRLFTGLPKWWQVTTHDIALLKGIDKHGYGRWEEVCSDPDLPFFAIAQSMRERVESERKGEHDAAKTDGAPPSTDGDSAPVKRESREEGEISDDNMDEDEVEDHDNNEEGAEDDNDDDDDGMNGEEGEGDSNSGGKKQARGVKRKRGGLLNRQVIDFPRETVLAKRLDYILKVALSSQMPDFVKRESSSSTSTSMSSSSSSSSSSSRAAAADSRKQQQSLDRFVKKDPGSKEKEKEKEKKRKRGDSDHEDHEAAHSSSTTRNGGKSLSSSSTAQARKKTKRSPSPVPARDHHAKERRDHHGAKERERDDEKESGGSAKAASAKGKKKGGKGGDKTPRTKKIVDLPTDEHGRVKMPIKIAGLTVLALGTVSHGPCTCVCVCACACLSHVAF